MAIEGEDRQSGRLAVRLFGDPSIEYAANAWTLKAPFRCFAILAMLSFEIGEPVSRASIASALWPEHTEDEAMANLRRHLHLIAVGLPECPAGAWILKRGMLLSWNPQAPVWTDLSEFRRSIRDGARAGAIDLYRGHLLGQRGESELLLLSQREQLRNECIVACFDEAVGARARLDFPLAVRYAEKMLHLDEWREDAVRLAMSLRYESGDRASALAVFERFAQRLGEEMGVDPMPETLALRDAIVMNDGLPPEAGSEGGAPRAGELVATPFVGRTRELEQLEAGWRKARRGYGATVFVYGDAGIGKTRLIGELVSIVDRQGGRIVIGETSNRERHPYEALVDALRKGLALVVEAPVKQPWLSSLAELLPELRATFSDLPAAEPLEPDDARTRLLEAIARTIERLAKARPLLLVLEDIHWAEQATLDAIEWISRRIGGVPAYFVLTYRTGEIAPGSALHLLRRRLLGEGRATTLELEPLGPPEIRAMVGHVAGIENPAGVADSIYDISDGNSLFAAQLLRSVVETGRLPARSEVPATLSQTIHARFGALDEAAQELLEVGAAIGTSFTVDLLAAVLGVSEGYVVDVMGGPLDRSLIRTSRSGASFGYAFAHDLIAGTVYAGIPDDRRGPYHRRIAGLLTKIHAGDPRMAGSIARHWERAGAFDRAVGEYLRAAQAALDVYARVDVVEFAQRALRYARDDRDRYEALLLEARARLRWSDAGDLRETLEQLAQAALVLGEAERFEAAMLKANFADQIGDRDAFESAFAVVSEMAESEGGVQWRMRALDAQGFHYVLLDEPAPAVRKFEEGLALARACDDRRAAVGFLARIIQAHSLFSEPEGARAATAALRKMLEQAPEANRLEVAFAEMALASVVEDGAWCRRIAAEVIEYSQLVGDVRREAIAQALLAHGLFLGGDAVAMRAHYAAAIDLFKHLGDLRSLGATYANYGFLEREIGHFDRAVALYDLAQEQVQFTGAHGESVIVINRAEVALHEGDVRLAVDLARRAVSLAQACSVPRLEVDALNALGSALVRAGRSDEGRQALRRGLELAKPGVSDRARSDVLCALVDALVEAGAPADAEPYAAELRALVLSRSEHQRYPTRVCLTLAEFEGARNARAAREWRARGLAILEETLARFELPQDRAAFAALPHNRALTADRSAVRRSAR